MSRNLLITSLAALAAAGCGSLEDQEIPGTFAEARAIGNKLGERSGPGNGELNIGGKFLLWWQERQQFIEGRGPDPCPCGPEPRTVREALAEIDRIREINLARETEFNRRIQAGELGAMAAEDEVRAREAQLLREDNDPAYQALMADQAQKSSAEQAQLARERDERAAEARAIEQGNQEDIARAAAANAEVERRMNDSIKSGRER